MSKIEYKTEGRVQIDCKDGNAKPIALTWRQGDVVAHIHSGGASIEVSKTQLEGIAILAGRVANDLEPGYVPTT